MRDFSLRSAESSSESIEIIIYGNHQQHMGLGDVVANMELERAVLGKERKWDLTHDFTI